MPQKKKEHYFTLLCYLIPPPPQPHKQISSSKYQVQLYYTCLTKTPDTLQGYHKVKHRSTYRKPLTWVLQTNIRTLNPIKVRNNGCIDRSKPPQRRLMNESIEVP